MRASVFFDAFAECLVNVGMVRRYPGLLENYRNLSISVVVMRHGAAYAEDTGRMFDRLLLEAQKPGTKR